MAITSAKTYLLHSATAEGTFAKLVDIIDYPDMGTSPSKLDTTTLSAERMKTFILGLQEAPELTFMANYTKAEYTTLLALEGTVGFYKVQFGEDGVDGEFSWSGEMVVTVNGKGVDEVRQMTITISAETEIEFA